ncbi:hypothetical protein Avbf_15334 [Armadillidium vulgare]|nr:hypothetical protein Avbf_15334 [Armadillidium vulgare]
MNDDFDDDIEELFYTPLKRKKMGHESIKNSQVTYSSVQSQIYPRRSPRKQSQNKRNLSQTSKNSKLKKNNPHIKVNNKPPVLFKEPENIKSYFKANPSQNTKLTSSKTESSKKNKAKCEESSDIEILNFNNNNKNINNNNIIIKILIIIILIKIYLKMIPLT